MQYISAFVVFLVIKPRIYQAFGLKTDLFFVHI